MAKGGQGRGASWARRLRVASAITLVLGFALALQVRTAPAVIQGLLQPTPVAVDPVALAGARLREVEQALPPRGVFGYRGAGPLAIGRNHELEVNPGDNATIFRYVIAQYVLAPRVLDLGRTAPLVVRDDLDPVRVLPREGR
jgi:hypothetical protein